ncbi:hypothetical protein KCU61_g8342, partial [Aureobasidium melanogenum]
MDPPRGKHIMDLPREKRIGFPSSPPTVLSGRPSKEFVPMTGKEHAEKFGDDRVSLLEVLKKARPHDITTQALEERVGKVPAPGDQPMKKFTEDDWYYIREGAFSIPEPPAERRRREQQSARDQRAARRSQEQPVAQTSEASSSDSTSAEDSQDEFVASSESEDFSPPPRGAKRKRTVTFKATDEDATKAGDRHTRRVLSDGDDEMAEATASRSRSVIPVPAIKKHSKRTTLADSDDEMGEPSVSRSRSVTPVPPIKKRSTRRTTLADSDDEMKPSVNRSRSVTPAPAVKRRKVEGKHRVTLADSDDEME